MGDSMVDSNFELFHNVFPPGDPRVPFDPSRHAAFIDKVPPTLAAEWVAFGFGTYGSGFLWTMQPDEPVFDPEDWAALDGTGIQILRTAFGDLFIWQGGNVLWLNVLNGKATTLTSNIELLFESALIQKQFREDALLERMFNIAHKQHGKLGPDECYGFAPLPALGGAAVPENIVKVKLREYVAMAAQVVR
jgi:hypothetical protein